MYSTTDKKEDGVVLVVVLLLLTLFGIVGVSFAFYASEEACDRNPTIEIQDGRCIKEVGPDRRP